MSVVSAPFGVYDGGRIVDRVVLANDHGVEVHALTYGCVITSIVIPDRTGARADVALGHETFAPYVTNRPYFGAIVGRYANRIANARFTLDGATHQLVANEGPHHLHGGSHGFDKQMWDGEIFEAPGTRGVTFSRLSADGEEHYPGNLQVRVTYALDDANVFSIDYEATTDAPTVLNLTQHTYFDLSAGAAADVLDHVLTLHASRFTPVDTQLIPTGELAAVAGTPFDFTRPVSVGSRIAVPHPQLQRAGGYDHNWVLDHGAGELGAAATLHDPRSGRTLDIATTEPGVQFYSGNFLDGTIVGKQGRAYPARGGLCLETQHFPDSPSHPLFPSTTLRPGDTFRSRTTWTFSW